MTTAPRDFVDDAAKHLSVANGLPARKRRPPYKLKLSEVDAWIHAGGARDAERIDPAAKQNAQTGRS